MVTNTPYPKRWRIAIAGTALQLCLGTVYAWSFFQQPLVEAYGWTQAQVAGVFSTAICALGLAAAWGGTRLSVYGPRRMAVTGGQMFGIGYIIAAGALRWKWLPGLYLGYGLIGGIGLGLGYVTPVATAAKWFPDRKGLVTGLVVMGFGFGALLMSKALAPWLMKVTGNSLEAVFGLMGAALGAGATATGSVLKNPDDGRAGAATASEPPLAALKQVWSARFIRLWGVFFCNILAGISMIAFQSPLFQDLWRKGNPSLSSDTLARYGATLIAASSIFNGLGRLFWGWVSDRGGRVSTFRLMLGTQALVFATLVWTRNPWVFGALICYVLSCYGGGFGIMPSFISDLFGTARMAVAYGAVLTAWAAAGVAGPQLIAVLKDWQPGRAAPWAFGCSAAALLLGLALTAGLGKTTTKHGMSG